MCGLTTTDLRAANALKRRLRSSRWVEVSSHQPTKVIVVQVPLSAGIVLGAGLGTQGPGSDSSYKRGLFDLV